MLLYAQQLDQIRMDVQKLENAGLNVTEMISAGHIIKLKIIEDQRDGRMYQIIGIFTPASHPPPAVAR